MSQKSGLEALDIGALSSEQQEKLKQFKINTRIANEKYLRSHPEVEMILGEFLREILLKRPGDIREFAAEYFTDPALPGRIVKKLEE
ncbi:RIIa domain-containing protein 1 [Acipenser ruthenus]|uniref:RIIa domain-containing protein 1 n=1 Tax=Acipenser ruthenus TaxID=7906 RepID=UPI0015613B0A|nr:RIIa domain-containing protein 1 [Acipenser ruthenus]